MDDKLDKKEELICRISMLNVFMAGMEAERTVKENMKNIVCQNSMDKYSCSLGLNKETQKSDKNHSDLIAGCREE